MSDPHGSEDLVVIDPLGAVRRLEGRMFRGSRYDPVQVVSLIVEEALLCGARDVDVRVLGRWIAIYSSDDWLEEDGDDVAADAFAGIRSYPAGGDNSMRAEVLLAAFAPAVFTVSSSTVVPIKGDPAALLRAHPDLRTFGDRVVAFLLDEAT